MTHRTAVCLRRRLFNTVAAVFENCLFYSQVSQPLLWKLYSLCLYTLSIYVSLLLLIFLFYTILIFFSLPDPPNDVGVYGTKKKICLHQSIKSIRTIASSDPESQQYIFLFVSSFSFIYAYSIYSPLSLSLSTTKPAQPILFNRPAKTKFVAEKSKNFCTRTKQTG